MLTGYFPHSNSPGLEICFSYRIVRGGNNICDGEVSTTNQSAVAKRIDSLRFGNLKQVHV